jgi:hypothetical protein
MERNGYFQGLNFFQGIKRKNYKFKTGNAFPVTEEKQDDSCKGKRLRIEASM